MRHNRGPRWLMRHVGAAGIALALVVGPGAPAFAQSVTQNVVLTDQSQTSLTQTADLTVVVSCPGGSCPVAASIGLFGAIVRGFLVGAATGTPAGVAAGIIVSVIVEAFNG